MLGFFGRSGQRSGCRFEQAGVDLRSGVDELQSLANPAMGELRIGSTEPVMASLLPTIIDRDKNIELP